MPFKYKVLAFFSAILYTVSTLIFPLIVTVICILLFNPNDPNTLLIFFISYVFEVCYKKTKQATELALQMSDKAIEELLKQMNDEDDDNGNV